jgi:hypothetical protein
MTITSLFWGLLERDWARIRCIGSDGGVLDRPSSCFFKGVGLDWRDVLVSIVYCSTRWG